MSPVRLADAIAEVPAGSEPAATPFEHKVKWHSYWEILTDVKEGRIVTPADEALATIRPQWIVALSTCPFCSAKLPRQAITSLFESAHGHGCAWVDARRKVERLEEGR